MALILVYTWGMVQIQERILQLQTSLFW